VTDILMPALSPTMEEGTLAKWLVKEGDTISAGQVIAEIETDKATMEVEAVDEGVLEAILVQAGAEGVKVNAPIARLAGGDAPAAAPLAPTGQADQQTQAGSPPAQENASSGAAKRPQGEHEAGSAFMTDQGVVPPPEGNPIAPPGAKALVPGRPQGANGAAQPTQPAQAPQPALAGGGGQRIFASPLARRLAKQAGLELSAIKGTGPHGRIVRADVEAAQKGGTAQAAPQAQAAAPQPAAAPQLQAAAAPAPQVRSLEQMGVQPGSYRLIPLDNIRKISARRLTDAFRDIPHFPLTIDLRIDNLLHARTRINAALESSGVKVSVNDIVMKAAAIALTRVPEANASFTPEGIALHNHADIAMAVAIEGGLITPVIRAAETKGLAQIATESKDLAKRAREKKLKPQEFQGGTFSVSNLGMFGIKSFSSIINEPGGCIMSVGAGEQQPVVVDGQLAVATVMTVTLTCDHRVVDGATGARFLQAFKPLVEDPIAMLA
jgi:pyruvate dehydrogenase E2 component (dihydrolipoamide acetyltransferase)